jgi:hypothetical protein
MLGKNDVKRISCNCFILNETRKICIDNRFLTRAETAATAALDQRKKHS